MSFFPPPFGSNTNDSETIIHIEASAADPSDSGRTILNPSDLIKWSSTDKTKMGLYCQTHFASADYTSNSILQSNSASVIDDQGKKAVFSFQAGSTYDEIRTSPLRAVYPYASGYSSIQFTVPSSQTQDSAGETTYGSASVPMVSDLIQVDEKTTVEGVSATVSTRMHILSSIAAFYVYDKSGAFRGEAVKNVKLQSASTDVAGITTYQLPGGQELPVLTGSSKNVDVTLAKAFSLQDAASKETSAPIYLSLIPGTFSGQIIVTTDVALYIFRFDTPKTFARAEVKEMALNLSNEKVERVALSSLVKPAATITKLVRKPVNYGTTYNDITLTVRKSNTSTIGFYVLAEKTVNSLIDKTDIMTRGEIVYFDDATTADYSTRVNINGGNFAFGIVPFDTYGNVGAPYGGCGYGAKSSTTTTDNPSNEY